MHNLNDLPIFEKSLEQELDEERELFAKIEAETISKWSAAEQARQVEIDRRMTSTACVGSDTDAIIAKLKKRFKDMQS